MVLKNYLCFIAWITNMVVILLLMKQKVLVYSTVIAKEYMTVFVFKTKYTFVQSGLLIALIHLALVFMREVEVNSAIVLLKQFSATIN